MEESIIRIKVERPRPSYKPQVRIWRSAAVWAIMSFIFTVGWCIWLIKVNTTLRGSLEAAKTIVVMPSGEHLTMPARRAR